MRLWCIARINLASGRTNVYNLAKTCEALAGQDNLSVTLITTDRAGDKEAFFKRQEISRPFPLISLGSTNTASRLSGRRWYELGMFFLANVHLAIFISFRHRSFDTLYFRDESLIPAVWWAKHILRKKVFFEVHSVLAGRPRQMLNHWSVRTADGVIAISAGLKRYYEKLHPRILLSLCSAAEPAWFDYDTPLTLLRQRLALPESAFLLGYAGVVGANPNNDYYELDGVVKSLFLLPPDVVVVVVGEIADNADWLRTIAQEKGVEERLFIRPWQERREIPNYLRACDILLIPRRKKDLVGDSPAKIFPALAARRPIVASRAECIEEVLTDGVNALIVKENTPAGWAKAVLTLYHDQEKGKILIDEAFSESTKYTWDKRGQAIAEFIKSR